MKLYSIFQTIDLDALARLHNDCSSLCDGYVLGNAPLLVHGTRAIKALQSLEEVPPIILDTQILDHEARIINALKEYEPHAMTVLAGTHNNVIHAASKHLKTAYSKAWLDLYDSSSHNQAALEAESLGVDALIFKAQRTEGDAHVLQDMWEMARQNTELPIYIYAKGTESAVNELLPLKPDGFIVEVDHDTKEYAAELERIRANTNAA